MFTVLVTVLFSVALQSPPASPNAQERSAALSATEVLLRTCLDKTESLARLDCYDRVARALTAPADPAAGAAPPTGAATAGATVGKWRIDSKINPLDDTKSYTAMLIASDGGRAALVLRCMSGETEAYIGWVKYLGRGSAEVTLRVGSGIPSTKSWSLSSDHSASFYPGNDRELIEQLATSDKLVAQVTPYSSAPITAVFNLAGIADVVAAIRDTCKWKD